MNKRINKHISLYTALAIILISLLALSSPQEVSAADEGDLLVYYDFDGEIANLTDYDVETVIPGGGRGATYSFGTDNSGMTDSTYLEWSGANQQGGFQIQSIIPAEIGSEYTIAIRFSLTQMGSWRKIVDYKNNKSDNGFYLMSDDAQLAFYPYQSIKGPSVYHENDIVDLVAVRSANGDFTVYTKASDKADAKLVKEFVLSGSTDERIKDDTVPYNADGKTILGFLGDDTQTSGEYSEGGRVYSVKVWNYALNAEEAETAADPPAGDVTVTFADVDGNPIDGIDPISCFSGDEFILPQLPTDDYNAWQTKGGRIYKPGDTISFDVSTKLTPTNAVTVKFSCPFTAVADKYYTIGSTFSNLPIPSTSYSFLGWYYDNEYSEKVKDGDSIPGSDDITLYAKLDLSHKHKLSYAYDDSRIIVSCDNYDANTEPCSIHEAGGLELYVDYVDGSFVINDKALWISEVGTSLPSIKYRGTGETVYDSSAKPTEPGTYEAYIEVTSPVNATIARAFEIGDDNRIIPEDFRQVYVPEEPSYINYELGEIDYSPRNHVIIYAYDLKDYESKGTKAARITSSYIDLTDEVFKTDMSIKAYSDNAGKSWKKITLKEFNAQLPKLFSKKLKLRFTDSFNEKTNKPGENATIIAFMDIMARPAITKPLTVNYSYCKDDYGITNGQWVLMRGSEMAPMENYEIGISDSKGSSIGSKGYGTWPGVRDGLAWNEYGGVWVSDLSKNGKTAKETYYYRITARIDAANYAVPASKAKKVRVSTVLAVPKVKVDYKNEIIKLKKGMNILFGDLPVLPSGGNRAISYILDLDNLNSEADYLGAGLVNIKVTSTAVKKGIKLENYISATQTNEFHIWIAAQSNKPASVILNYSIAKRAPAPTSVSKVVTIKNGRARLSKGYEIYNSTKGKWAKSLPSDITDNTEFIIREAATAKGGRENNKTYATGVEAILSLEYGVINDKTDKMGITGATLEELDV